MTCEQFENSSIENMENPLQTDYFNVYSGKYLSRKCSKNGHKVNI